MLYGQRYEKLRDLLKEIRNGAALTQVQLAEKLGRGQSYVSKVERGEQYVDLVQFIEWCEACNTQPAHVIGAIQGVAARTEDERQRYG